MGWVGRPMDAICGAPARKRLAAALLGPITAVTLLAVACGKSDEPLGPGGSAETERPVEAVVPLGSIVPLNGGSSLPDPALVLLRKASQDLKSGNFDAAAQAAQQARQQAGQQAGPEVRPGARPEPEGPTRSIADAVEGVADINRNKIEMGLALLQHGENAIQVVPDDVRTEMATLIYRAQAVGYARAGENDAAESSLNKALAVAPATEADLIVKEVCRETKGSNSIARCASPPSSVTPPKPPPATPTTSESPKSGESPEVHGSPDGHDHSKGSTGKPTESKPTESKPTESKPTESKPTESKPTESKPTESKPTESKPTGSRPTEKKPTEKKPTEKKPTEDKPAEGRPAEGKPTKNDMPSTDTPSPRPGGS